MRTTWIERSLASRIRVGEITTHHGSIEFNDDWVVERHVLKKLLWKLKVTSIVMECVA